MNKINKSCSMPHTLINEGNKETEELCKLVDAGVTDLSFKNGVYAAADVKKQLKIDQHGKCAYCERFLNGDYGAVEHFRPKGGYDSGKEDVLHKPGYYWLAYSWDNLLYSCSECNTSYKRNHFPLLDETTRNISSRDIEQETPLLLHPALENVGDYLAFARHHLIAKDGSPESIQRAKGTIDLLGLNRPELLQRRRQCWESYENCCDIREIALAEGNVEMVDLCNSVIAKMASEDAEFTGMFRYQLAAVKTNNGVI